MPDDWRRYVAPAAFLLAATIAVVLIRSGFETAGDRGSPSVAVAPTTTTRKRVDASTTTTKAKPAATPATAKGFWTVQPGDTFGVISSKTGVPVATLEQLNPKVKSTSLFIGEKIRIK